MRNGTSTNTFAGIVEIKKGVVSIGNGATNLGTGVGGNKVILGNSAGGSNAATLTVGDNSNQSFATPIELAANTTGLLTIRLTEDSTTASHSKTFTGGITGNNSLTIENNGGTGTFADTINFTTNQLNFTGSLTHIGTGTGASTISSVIGPLVTGVTQNSATSRMVLSGANTYTGTTTINGGTLTLNRFTGSLSSSTALTFGGNGTFNMDNVGASGALTQSLGALAFNAGSGTVQITRTAAQDQLITFASLAARATGATGNFVTGGTPSATNGIKLTSTSNAPLDSSGSNNPGFFFGGSEYARYDTGGFFRATTYGTDNNALATIGASGSGLPGIDATKDVKITGAITGQTVASVNTINLGANNFTISSGILSVNGLLSTGTLAFGGGTIQPTSSGGEIVVNTNAGTLTLSSSITNNATASSLTKTGAGTLVLSSGTNTGLTGTTYVNQGTLRFNSTNSMPLGTTIVQSGATLLMAANLTRNVTLNGGTLSANTSDVTYTLGTITLTADSTFSGGSKNIIWDNTAVIDTGAGYTANFISAAIRNSLSLNTSPLIRGSGGIILANGGQAYALNNTNTYTGPTRFTNTPAGTASFNTIGNVGGGASSFGAPTTVANGTITLGSGTNVNAITYIGTGSTTDRVIDLAGTTGGITIDQSGSGNLKFTSNFTASGAGSKTLTLQGPGGGTGEIAGVIQNNSGTNITSLTKAGAGIWILSGANGYTGATTVSAGTLFLTGNNSTASVTTSSTGTVIARSATALGTGNVTVGTQTNLTYNAATDTPLSIAGTLGITGGTTTTIGASIGSTFSGARINVAGNATTTAAAVKVNIYGNSLSGTTSGNGTYTLVQGNGGSNTLNNATYTLGTVYNATNFTVGTTIGSTTGTVTAAITTATPLSGTVYWRGTGTAGISRVWAASNGNAGSPDSNWTATNGSSTPTVLVPGSGVDVVVSSSALNFSGTPVGTTLGSDMSINSLTISDPSFGLGLNADGYKLTIGNSAGITQTATSAGSVIAADVALGASQSWTNNSASSLTVSGSVSGAFAITKLGTGTLVLSGNNTYAGTTSVSAGVLTVRSDAALGSTAGGTSITSGAALQILAFAPLSTQQGTLSVGAEALTINGTGYNNDNTGALRNIAGTNFYGGTVTLGSASRINSDANTLTLTAANSITGTQNLTLGGGGNGVVSGTITTGSGTLTKDGLGAWTLSGANTYTGATTINGGTLQVGNGTGGSLNSTTGTALTFGNSGSFIVSEASGVSQGMGTLTFSAGNGTITSTNNGGTSSLSFSSLAARPVGATGNFVLSGGTAGTPGTPSGGVLGTNNIVLTGVTASQLIDRGLFYNGSAYAAYDAAGFVRGLAYGTDTNTLAAIAGGSNLGVNDATKDVKITGAITGQTAASVNTINLGANAFTISSGTLSVNGLLSTGTQNFSGGTIRPASAGGEIVINTAGGILTSNSTFTNFTSASTLTKTGAGTLILSGDNTGLTGTTYVNQGTLQLNTNANSMPAGTTIVQSGATLLMNVASAFTRNVTLNGGTLSGNGSADMTFAATVTLTADSTISGGGKNIFWNNSSVIDTGAGYTANFISGAFRTSLSGPLIIGNGGVILATTSGQQGPVLLRPNTYTGPTKITSTPTLYPTVFNTIGNVGGGASSFGAPTTVANGTITLGSGANQNTMSYQGTGSTTDRVIDLAGTTGGITIEQSGTGNLKFTSNFTASGAGSKTLTLSGSTVGTGEIAGVIPNNSGTNITSLTKSGSGLWTLGGANVYTGNTLVSQGTLQFAKQVSLYNNGAAAAWSNTNINVSSGATMAFNIGGSGEFTKANILTLLGLANATTNGFQTGAILGLDTTSGDFLFDSVIANPFSGANVLDLTKLGTNKLTLDQANTYTGANRINLGTLAGTQTSGTPFGTGAVTLNAGTLSLAPTGSGSNVALTGGTVAAATAFTFNPDATLSLNKGSQTSLTYTFGFGGASATWTRGTNGTLILSVGAIANLGAAAGSGERFLINGTAPAVVGTANLVSGVVAQDRAVSNAGDFVTYGATNGFAAATPTLLNDFTGSLNTSYVNVTSPTSTGTIAAYAVKVSGTTLTNSGTLTLGNVANTAGLILNSGIISGGTLTTPVAAAEFVFYTSGTSEISSVIPTATGMIGMSVFGPGTLALTSGSANTFTGGLRINNSTVIATNNNQLGGTSSAITLTGGTLQTSTTFALGGGTRAITLSPGQDQTGGTFNVTGGTTTYQNSSTSSKFMSGSGSLTKTGAGILVLSGNTTNTYTGLTTVDVGTLEVTVNSALGTNAAGTSVTAGATLKLTGVTYSTAEGLIINGTGLSSGGALASSGTTTFAGLITAATSATINAISGTLELSGGLVKNGTTLTFTGAGAFTISSVISGASANSDLVVDGTTVTLTAVNTYNGPTEIKNGGTLNANLLDALPLSPRSAMSFTGAGNTLNLGASQVVASLTSAGAATVALGSHTLTVGIAGGPDTTFAGSIGGTNGNLIKDTNSKQILSGSNGYTGTTTVSAGTLEVQGSLSGTTAVTVNTGGTLLLNSAASPIINTAATMTVGGGTVKIDNSLSNTNQTFGSLTLTGTSILDFGTGSNGNTMTFSSLSFSTTKLNVYNWSGSAYGAGVADTGTLAGDTQDRLLFTGTTGIGTSGDSRIEFFSDGGSNSLGFGQQVAFGSQFELVPITAVPEPATTALIGSIALCALIGYRERRRFTGLGKRTAARK